MPILMFLLAILTIGSILAGISLLISFFVHIDMVKTNSSCRSYDYVTFERFLEEANKYELIPSNMWKGSFFSKDNKAYIHASIIRFGDKGMIMRDPLEYLEFLRWKWNNTPKDAGKRQKGLWR